VPGFEKFIRRTYANFMKKSDLTKKSDVEKNRKKNVGNNYSTVTKKRMIAY